MTRAASGAVFLAGALLAAGLFAASPAEAAARASAPRTDPDVVGPIQVRTLDRTADSCWTNAAQVEDYAEERLEKNGFDVVEDGEDPAAGRGKRSRAGHKSAAKDTEEEGYVLYVGVAADRSNGACAGTVHIFLAKPTWSEGEPGPHKIGPETSLVSTPKSVNVYVLGKLRAFIEQM